MFLTEAIRDKAVFGTFIKFLYYCNGFIEPIYCRSEEDFNALVNSWNLKSKQYCNSKFQYAPAGQGATMSLEQIAADYYVKGFSTSGSRVLKMYLIDPYTNKGYIQ